jgi:hypothetical protein
MELHFKVFMDVQKVELKSPIIHDKITDLSSIEALSQYRNPHVIIKTRSSYISIHEPFLGMSFYYSASDEGIIEPLQGDYEWVKNDEQIDFSRWVLVDAVNSDILFYTLAAAFGEEFPDQIDNLSIVNDDELLLDEESGLFVTYEEALNPEANDAIANGDVYLNEDEFGDEAEVLIIKDGDKTTIAENFYSSTPVEEKSFFEFYDWLVNEDELDNLMDSAKYYIDGSIYFLPEFEGAEKLLAVKNFFEDYPNYKGFPYAVYLLTNNQADYRKALAFLSIYTLVTDNSFLTMPPEYS